MEGLHDIGVKGLQGKTFSHVELFEFGRNFVKHKIRCSDGDILYITLPKKSGHVHKDISEHISSNAEKSNTN